MSDKPFNGYRLKMAREMKMMTSHELAASMDVAVSVIHALEAARMQPDKDLVSKICFKLEFLPSWYYLDDPPDFPMGTLLFHGH